MRRAILLVGALVLGAAVAPGVEHARTAASCSFLALQESNLTETIERSDVIAVGTLAEAEGDVLFLRVEEGWKGSEPGAELRINNATNLDCAEAHEPGRRNYDHPARVRAFLSPDPFGVADYKVERFGWDIFRIDGQTLRTHIDGGTATDFQLPALDRVRDAVASAPGAPPVHPDDALDPVSEADPGSSARAWTAIVAVALVIVAAVASAGAILARRRA